MLPYDCSIVLYLLLLVLGTQECAISPFTDKELLFVLANAELQNADRN